MEMELSAEARHFWLKMLCFLWMESFWEWLKKRPVCRLEKACLWKQLTLISAKYDANTSYEPPSAVGRTHQPKEQAVQSKSPTEVQLVWSIYLMRTPPNFSHMWDSRGVNTRLPVLKELHKGKSDRSKSWWDWATWAKLPYQLPTV